MTLSTSAVAVCCWSDSRSSLSSRVFSIAMTACLPGEILDQFDLLVGERPHLLAVARVAMGQASVEPATAVMKSRRRISPQPCRMAAVSRASVREDSTHPYGRRLLRCGILISRRSAQGHFQPRQRRLASGLMSAAGLIAAVRPTDAGSSVSAMYGRRPRCKGKESDFFAKRSGAAMYPAFECSRSGCWP
jgi:hypothetical protein